MGVDLKNTVKLNIYQPVSISYTNLPVNNSSKISCEGCNSVSIKNMGTATVTIDRQIVLIPGAAVSFNGNLGEFLTNIFEITYSVTGTQNVLVTKATYQ